MDEKDDKNQPHIDLPHDNGLAFEADGKRNNRIASFAGIGVSAEKRSAVELLLAAAISNGTFVISKIQKRLPRLANAAE